MCLKAGPLRKSALMGLAVEDVALGRRLVHRGPVSKHCAHAACTVHKPHVILAPRMHRCEAAVWALVVWE